MNGNRTVVQIKTDCFLLANFFVLKGVLQRGGHTPRGEGGRGCALLSPE